MFWREHWGVVLSAILVLPIASAFGFWLWIRHEPGINLDNGVKCWEVFIKLISAITVVVSGAMVFGKYIEEHAQAAAVAARQADRELALREADLLRQKLAFETEHHVRKVKLLGEAKTVVARIASTKPDAASMTRFNELYQADLIGVEELHGEVEAAMVRFRRKLRSETPAPDESIEDLSLGLSAAVETELKKSEDRLLEQHRAIAALLSSPSR